MESILDWQTLLVFVLVFLIIWMYLSTQLPDGFPRGPRPLPILGNLLVLAGDPKDIPKKFGELSKTYGPIVGLKMGSIPTILLNDLDSIKEMLVKHGDAFSGRPHNMYIITEINRNPPNGPVRGVLWTQGEVWKKSRRFALSAMRDFGVGKKSIELKIQEEAEAMCGEFSLMIDQPINPQKLLQRAVSNIICSVCFGSRFDYTDPEFNKLMDMLNENFSTGAFRSIINFYPFFRFLPKQEWYHKVMSNVDKVVQWLDREIQKHRETYDSKEIRDFVDLYLSSEYEEDNEVVSPHNMNRLILDIFVAGTETSAAALRWLLLYLIYHPDVQVKVHKEIDKIVGQSRMAKLEDRQKMPYMDAVLHETLRLSNIAGMPVPHSAERDVVVRGYKIPKDTLILPNASAVHMDKNLWDQPEKFNPERWIDEAGNFQKNEAFLAFSIGPRACLGETLARSEMFLFATTMLQRFNVEMADPSNPPPVHGTLGITNSPVNFDIIFKNR